ncbi:MULTISPECIES: hypothetical protein [unclassified Sphingomonas]|uniref:hypothetical protein n=1 Tax=unclassified Sphingomonas TaxID=196159 RepID=UPI0012E23265|nr:MULTISPECIES: hypothetical protein [unclassified Sphingomonas]
MTERVSYLQPAHSIQEDRARGLIYIKIEGFFDLATLKRHFRAETAVVDRWRAEHRPIRVLIDAVNLLPHSTECQAHIQRETGTIYRAGDRVALHVSSSLVKMQMRRAFTQGNTLNFFISNDAARMWLDAKPDEPMQG